MTLEDINDPKWVVYDKKGYSRTLPKQVEDTDDKPKSKDDGDLLELPDLENDEETLAELEEILDPDNLNKDTAKITLDDFKDVAQMNNEFDDLLITLEWDVGGYIFYEKQFKDYFVRITVFSIRADRESYSIRPSIFVANPDYDQKDPFSKKHIEKGKGKLSQYYNRKEAEDQVWFLTKKYDNIFGGI